MLPFFSKADETLVIEEINCFNLHFIAKKNSVKQLAFIIIIKN